MQIVKLREEPLQVLIFKAMEKRVPLSFEQKRSKANRIKGFEGEKKFDEMIEKTLQGEGEVLHDLQLIVKGNKFQVDSLILAAGKVYLYEVKSYAGDYVMKGDNIYTLTGQEISNPLTQLRRSSSLLRQLFQSWGMHMTVEANIILVDSTCTIYCTQPEDPIIFPGQISSHFNRLSSLHSNASQLSQKTNQLSVKLLEVHEREAAINRRVFPYKYEDMAKGLFCGECGSDEIQTTQRSASCKRCHHSMSVTELVLKQIEEFKLLFPESKVTVAKMYDWCGENIRMKRIRRILVEHYKKTSSSVGTYYT